MISMLDITVVNSTLVSKSKPFKVDAPSTNGGTERGMGPSWWSHFSNSSLKAVSLAC